MSANQETPPAGARDAVAWPARFGCNGPEGSFWTDDSALANKLIAATYDRDEWTVTDTTNPTGISSKLVVDTQPAATGAGESDVREQFTEWLAREMPPGTVISNPRWWAPKIIRAFHDYRTAARARMETNTAAPGMGDAIAACPFCGKTDHDDWPIMEASGDNTQYIRCAWCHGSAPKSTWNRRAALAAQPAPVVGGEGYVEQHARDSKELRRLCGSRDFYKRRCDALQAVQSNMRDPERKAVCDILANGSTELLAARPGGDDSARIDWLESNEADLVTHRESENAAGEYSIWWNVVMDNGSVSGHPLGYARDAIDEAMRLAAKANPAQAGGDSAAALSSGAEGA